MDLPFHFSTGYSHFLKGKFVLFLLWSLRCFIKVFKELENLRDMSQVKDYNYISQINPDKETWKIVARIIRLWKFSPNSSTNEIKALQMVLLDEKGDTIQASIWLSDIISKLKDFLIEGNCYSFENFRVGLNSGDYRPTRNAFRINLHAKTAIKHYQANIAQHSFNFVPFEDIIQNTFPKGYLIDVIGQLINMNQVGDFQQQGISRKFVTLDLQDQHDNNISCILYGEHAETAFSYISQSTDPTIVVVLHLARVKSQDGKNILTTSWNTTNIMFNPMISEVLDFQSRLNTSQPSLSWKCSQVSTQTTTSLFDELLDHTSRKSLSEIRDSSTAGKFVTMATVHKIQTRLGWFYDGCHNCPKKVTEEDGMKVCNMCKKKWNEPMPRFRIQIQVIDKTGSASFVIFDKVAFKLMNKTAAELLKQLKAQGSENSFPKELDYLVNKTYIFKVDVTDNSLNNSCATYTVSKMSDDPDLIETFISLM